MFSIDSIWSVLLRYWPTFLSGLLGTLKTATIVVIIGTLCGAILALLKMIKFKPLQFVISAYVEVIRGTPLLLQLYFFYFGLPMMLPFDISKEFSIILALIVNSSAYVSEIFRAGIFAVDHGQVEAAESLGMSSFHMMTRIIMPQAIKNILPALGNEFVMMIKETSLSSTFYMTDLMTSYRIVNSASFKTIEPLIILAVIYFVLTFTFSRIVKYFEWRLSISD